MMKKRTDMGYDGESVHRQLAAVLGAGSVLRRQEPLARRTTLRVGGRAEIYVEPADEGELASVLQVCGAQAIPVFVLGRGSNVLVRDGGIRGVVVCLANPSFCGVAVAGDRVQAGAGAKLRQVAIAARRAGLGGLEFLEGIPGSVGGALRMNAGAMGSWIFDRVDSIRWMNRDGRVEERPRSEVDVQYRRCPSLCTRIALRVHLRGERVALDMIERRAEEFNRRRWATQPAAPSAGCIFKNPEAMPAGKLIDALGLKGTRVGGAVVSDVHANFIVNEGDATAADVLRLIELVRQRVRADRGIDLETEVQIVGE